MNYARTILLLLTSAIAIDTVHAQDPSKASDAVAKLTPAFRALGEALRKRDTSSFLVHFEDVGRYSAHVGASSKQHEEHTETYAQQQASLLRQLAKFAKGSEFGKATDVYESLRRNCVSCHVRLRGDNDKRGIFPATGNLLWGFLGLRKKGGKAKKGRAGVVVFVDSAPGTWKPPVLHARISQRDRRFHPSVLPIVEGTAVDFPNDDVIFHNVFSLSKAKPFDLGIYGAGRLKAQSFDRRGLVKIYCHIHSDMVAHVLVRQNPFYSTTSEDGFWVIDGIPDGAFKLRTWHQFGGGEVHPVQLTGGETRRVALEVLETRVRVQHRNKFGRPYRVKYGK